MVLASPKLTTRFAAIESTQRAGQIRAIRARWIDPYGVVDLLRRNRLLGPALSISGLAAFDSGDPRRCRRSEGVTPCSGISAWGLRVTPAHCRSTLSEREGTPSRLQGVLPRSAVRGQEGGSHRPSCISSALIGPSLRGFSDAKRPCRSGGRATIGRSVRRIKLQAHNNGVIYTRCFSQMSILKWFGERSGWTRCWPGLFLLSTPTSGALR